MCTPPAGTSRKLCRWGESSQCPRAPRGRCTMCVWCGEHRDGRRADWQTFEEVIIPPARQIPPKQSEKPVRIADLPPLARGCFPASRRSFFDVRS